MALHRWMKFWPGDWKGDAALRMCGLAARGMWIECIAIMHDAEPYGHLLVNGRQPSVKQIGAMVGTSERDAARMLAELEDAGVFSRAPDGTIYSRRMVRDKVASDRGREMGRAGGNPALVQRSADDDNAPPNGGGLSGGDNPPPKHLETETEERRKKPPSPPSVVRSPRGCRLSADWQPAPADVQFAAGLRLDPDRVAANFRDYWHAKAGKDGVKIDWPATWRGWCRREAERLPRPGTPPPSRQSNLSWMVAELARPSTDSPDIIDVETLQ